MPSDNHQTTNQTTNWTANQTANWTANQTTTAPPSLPHRYADAPGVTSVLAGMVGKVEFELERDAFAEAIAWTARGLPTRPVVPVTAGVVL